MTAVSAGQVTALVVASLAAFPVYCALVAMNSRQNVSRHLPEHATKQGTPTMGGIIVLAGGAAGMMAAGAPWAPFWLLCGFAMVGLIDDFIVPRLAPGSRGLSWIPKLSLQAVVAGAVAAAGSFDWIWVGITGIIVLLYANAFNFSDGMDGLAGGLFCVFALGLAAVAYLAGAAGHVWPVVLPMAAAVLPFLGLNAHPAKVFMGDIGALPLGALLGWCVGETLRHAESPVSVSAPLVLLSLVLLAEVLPVPLQIGWVKLTGRRLFPFKTPVHHGFQAAGWPETRTVALFHLVQAGLVVVAVALCLRSVGA